VRLPVRPFEHRGEVKVAAKPRAAKKAAKKAAKPAGKPRVRKPKAAKVEATPPLA